MLTNKKSCRLDRFSLLKICPADSNTRVADVKSYNAVALKVLVSDHLFKFTIVSKSKRLSSSFVWASAIILSSKPDSENKA